VSIGDMYPSNDYGADRSRSPTPGTGSVLGR